MSNVAPKPPSTRLAPSAPREREVATPAVTYDWQKVWLAPPAALLGFGLGHVVQNRFHGYPIVYPIADGVGFLAIALSMGSCAPPNADACNKRSDRWHNFGLGLLIASRLAQLIDVTLWSINYEGEPAAKVTVVPSPGGATLAAKFSF